MHPIGKITRDEFAQRIKSKYPDYKDLDNTELVNKMIEKYPEYKEQLLDFGEKKSGLEVGADGQLQKSVPTTSQSQGVPDFSMASFADLAKGQRNVAENTKAVAPKEFEQATDPTIYSPEIVKQRQKAKQGKIFKALDNTTKKSLQLKGINAQEGSAQYNEAKSKYALAVATGDAHVALDKDGVPGLKRTTGALENLAKGWNEALIGNAENQSFANMTYKERVEYYNQNRDNPNKIKHIDEYIGESPSLAGAGGHLLSSNAPYLLKAGAGAALGAATGGAGAPAAFAFLLTTPDMINSGIKNTVISNYEVLRKQHPELSEEQAMEQASRFGDLIGGVSGIATNAAFMGSGLGKKVSSESSNLFKNSIEHVFKPAAKIGLTTAGITAAEQEASNLDGIHRTQAEIFKNSVESLKENTTSGFLLMSMFHLPKVLKSISKYILIKEENQQNIEGALKANEQAGNVSEGTTEKTMSDLNEYRKALDTVIPNLTPETEASVAGLIQARSNIEKEAKTKDASAQPFYKEKTEAINQQIQEIQRTGKPFEHEIDEATGETYKQPTFDNIAAMRVKNLADKISKGKPIEDSEDLQTQANFHNELEKQLQKLLREEKAANKDKVNPNTEISDNVNGYLDNQTKETEKTKVEIPKSITEESKVGEVTDEEKKLLEPHKNSHVFMGMETDGQKLKYIADQSQNVNDKGEKDASGYDMKPQMIRNFGEPLVEAAIKKYPAPKEETVVPIVSDNKDVSDLRNANSKDEIKSAILKATQSDNLNDALDNAEGIIGKSMYKAIYYTDPKKFANELADSIEQITKNQPKSEPKPKSEVPIVSDKVNEIENKFQIAKNEVDGRTVREHIPNIESIGSSLNDYKELDGIREVPMSEIKDTPKGSSKDKKIQKLASDINTSKEINPLIVVVDKNGSYILEGSNRIDALHELGAKSFPAKVVIDLESFKNNSDKAGELYDAAKKFKYEIWNPNKKGELSGKEANDKFDKLSKETGFSKEEIQSTASDYGDFTRPRPTQKSEETQINKEVQPSIENKNISDEEISDMMKPLRGKIKSKMVKVNEIDSEGNVTVKEVKAKDAHFETVKQIKLTDLIIDCLTKH